MPSTAVLDVLSQCKTLSHIKQLHAHILRTVSDHNRLNTFLFNLSSSSSSINLNYSLSLFSSLPSPPQPFLFNLLLRNLSRSSQPRAAILFYQRIRRAGGRLDRFSFTPILKAAAKVSALFEGTELHGLALKTAAISDPFVKTAVLDMYACCGRIVEARKVFDEMPQRDVVTWNTMIERLGIIFFSVSYKKWVFTLSFVLQVLPMRVFR